MMIPKEHIEKQKEFVMTLQDSKYLHYRDIYKNIDKYNFQICTKVDFKAVGNSCGDIFETWDKLKQASKITYEANTKSGSRYFIDEYNNVYRLSNHWGAVATCEWTREGKGQLSMSIFETGEWEIGVANLKDFKIFRRKQDRNIDFIINPKWLNQMKEVIQLKKELFKLKSLPEFKELPVEDKILIGTSYHFFNKELGGIEKRK